MNANVKNFLSEVDSWTRNPNYFQSKVRTVSIPIIRLKKQCLSELTGYLDLGDVCYLEPTLSGTRTVSEPTNLSAEAREFAGLFGVKNGRIDPDVSPDNPTARNMDRILSSVFGVEMLNGQLRSACQTDFEYDALGGIPCNDARVNGLILLHQAVGVQQEIRVPAASRASTPVGGRRKMTAKEKTLVKSQGLDAIDLDSVRIAHVSEAIALEDVEVADGQTWYVLLGFPYIIFVPEHVVGKNDGRDFAEDFTDIRRQSILIHELAHLHQNQKKWRYDTTSGNSFDDIGEKAYEYRTRSGMLEHNDFFQFSSEEQAEIMEDRFLLKNNMNPHWNCRAPGHIGRTMIVPCNKHPTKSIAQMYGELDGLSNIPADDD